MTTLKNDWQTGDTLAAADVNTISTQVNTNTTTIAAGINVASTTHAATSKSTPVDADEIPVTDSASSFALKKVTWANLKATLKTYFDSLTTTYSNKTIALGSNTVSGTTAQFNTANTDADFYTTGGTDVALADGGTGASLADPNADRIMFWDDSAGAMAFLTPGTNLTITGTTIDATGGGGGGDASTNTSSSVDSEVALFSGTAGKTLKRATGTGITKLTSGVLSVATAGTDYYNPSGTDVAVTDGGTGRSTSTTAYGVIAAGTTATGAQQTISPGTSGHFMKSAGAAALPAFSALTSAEIVATGALADAVRGLVFNVTWPDRPNDTRPTIFSGGATSTDAPTDVDLKVGDLWIPSS